MKNFDKKIEEMLNKNKEQEEILKGIKAENEEKRKSDEHKLRRLLTEGYIPEEIAEILDIEIKEVERVRTMEGWVTYPDYYLNGDEMKEFNELIKKIRESETYMEVNEHHIFKFINNVMKRYENEFENYKEEDDEVKINGDYSLNKFGINSRAKDIKRYLIKRLFREVEKNNREVLCKDL